MMRVTIYKQTLRERGLPGFVDDIFVLKVLDVEGEDTMPSNEEIEYYSGIADIVEVDGAELQTVRASLPHLVPADVLSFRWYGDLAKMILWLFNTDSKKPLA